MKYSISALPARLEAELAKKLTPFAGPGDEDGLELDLIEAGVPIERIKAVVAVVERRATEKAAELVRHVVLSLGKTPKAFALQRALLGEFQSLSKDARELGISKQRLYKAEEKADTQLKRQFG